MPLTSLSGAASYCHIFQSPKAKRLDLPFWVSDGGKGGDSRGLVIGFEVYVEQVETRVVRVPRAEATSF